MVAVFIHPHSTSSKSVHILQNREKKKKEVTGHNKATIQKQLYIAEVGIFSRKVEMPPVCMYVWMDV